MSVYGYVRVSEPEQAKDGHSIGVQARNLKAYAVSKGLWPAQFVVDKGVSAKIPLLKRRYGRYLSDLKPGDHVIITAIDRAFRSVFDGAKHIEDWDKRGISIHILNLGGNTIDASTAQGKMFLHIMLAVAQGEREMIAERTRAVFKSLRAKGYFDQRVGCARPPGIHPPIGKKRVLIGKINSHGKYRPLYVLQDDEQEWETIRFIVKCRLHTPPWSWKQIEEHLRRHGIKNTHGRDWNVSRMKRVFRMWTDRTFPSNRL